MTAKIRELKTDRSFQKEEMLEWVEHLTAQIQNDEILSFITITEEKDGVLFEVKGEVNDVQAIGMLEVAKHGFVNGFFCTHE